MLRAYAIPARLDGRTVAEVERAFAPARVFAERLRTPEGIIDPTPSTVLRAGHILALSGRLATHVEPGNPLAGTEVDDPELLNIPAATVEVVIRAKSLVGRTLGDLAETVVRDERSWGVFVREIRRGGQALPFGPGTVVERGDVVTLAGPAAQASKVAALVGHTLSPATTTDFLALAIAIALGGLVGLASVHVARARRRPQHARRRPPRRAPRRLAPLHSPREWRGSPSRCCACSIPSG